jgi:hypothetical protein
MMQSIFKKKKRSKQLGVVAQLIGRQEDHEFDASRDRVSKILAQKKKGWGCSLVVVCLPSKCKTLGSLSSTTKEKGKEGGKERKAAGRAKASGNTVSSHITPISSLREPAN